MKKIFGILIAVCLAGFASAQNVDEALLYADQNFYGTARSSAMGGAFSSLGGDITVASTNPAGLAIFRKSSASFTPALRFSSWEGTGISGEKSNFIMPSAGFVLETEGDGGSLQNWSFAITYNQATNFNMKKNVDALDSNYSLLDDITVDANEPTPYLPSALQNYDAALLPSLAYNTYLISPDNNTGEYYSPLQQGDVMDRMTKLENEGSSGEVAFSAAGNYDNKLYFGGTLGIQNIDFHTVDNYQERVTGETSQSILDRFYYDQDLHRRGTGINLKLGVIFRATDQLRLGFAAHTPTYFAFEEEYLYAMESTFLKEPEAGKGTQFKQVYPKDEKTGVYEYNYRTPWKLTFGGSYILGKVGLISVDYDLVDYGSAKFSNDDFDVVNNEISDTYKMAGTLKMGAELRLSNQFSLRGGYNHFGNMYREKSSRERNASLYSAGLGYRYKNIFLDASYQYYSQENITKYDDFADTQNHNVGTAKLTVGFQF